jgi:hypothetical protein
LDANIVAASTGILINASRVVLNLNGRTITYNQSAPGAGVAIGSWNNSDVAIINGSIIQGAAMSEGNVYGDGNNPVRTTPYLVPRLQIANISARYGGRDVGGFRASGGNLLIEENTLEDTYEFGTVKDRHQGIDAIYLNGSNNIVRNNVIINTRHRGIYATPFSKIYGNTIGIRSICTNSAGIFVYGANDSEIYNNKITGRGEHPIGIIAHGFATAPDSSFNYDIHDNIIDVQTTRLGLEYGGGVYPGPTALTKADYAVGIRSTNGVDTLSVHNNTITVRTDSYYAGTWSPTGEPVLINGGGRGLMVGLRAVGQRAKFWGNSITVTDKDGTGNAFGIACVANIAGTDLVFDGNTVTGNNHNAVLSDDYGWCSGHPLFQRNVFVKSENYPAYRTIAAEVDGWFEGTGRFISNDYRNGAAESSLSMNFQSLTNASSNKNKSVIFGRLMNASLKDANGNVLPNVRVRIYDNKNTLQSTSTTSANGSAQFMVYDYELNNNNGQTGSPTPITVTFAPHTIELYDIAAGRVLWTTAADGSPSAWDALNSKGFFLFNHASGSLTVSTLDGASSGAKAPSSPRGLLIR